MSVLLPTRIFHLSFFFTHQLLPTYLQFSDSDCPLSLQWPVTYISLLYKSSFCHFSFSLWSTRDPARWPCATTRVDGGWDPVDWGYCWALASHYQHITLVWTSAQQEVRKARPDQLVGGTSLVGVFHQGQSGIFNPWVYSIHSPDVTSPDIPQEIDIPFLGLLAGGEWIKWTDNKPYYGHKNEKKRQVDMNIRTMKYGHRLWTGLIFSRWSLEMMHCQSPRYHHLQLTKASKPWFQQDWHWSRDTEMEPSWSSVTRKSRVVLSSSPKTLVDRPMKVSTQPTLNSSHGVIHCWFSRHDWNGHTRWAEWATSDISQTCQDYRPRSRKGN